jgi:hypothetical protein
VYEILRNWVEDRKLGLVSLHEASNQLVVKCLPARMDEVEAIVNQLGGKRVGLDKPERPVMTGADRMRVDVKLVLVGENREEKVREYSAVLAHNTESCMHYGKKRAYVTSTTSQAQETVTVAEDVNFIDLGVVIRITPSLSYDGWVAMQVRAELSRQVSVMKTATSEVPEIETKEFEATTVVHRDEGYVKVVSGADFDTGECLDVHIRVRTDKEVREKQKGGGK